METVEIINKKWKEYYTKNRVKVLTTKGYSLTDFFKEMKIDDINWTSKKSLREHRIIIRKGYDEFHLYVMQNIELKFFGDFKYGREMLEAKYKFTSVEIAIIEQMVAEAGLNNYIDQLVKEKKEKIKIYLSQTK